MLNKMQAGLREAGERVKSVTVIFIIKEYCSKIFKKFLNYKRRVCCLICNSGKFIIAG
jgi:hypothetical protein